MVVVVVCVCVLGGGGGVIVRITSPQDVQLSLNGCFRLVIRHQYKNIINIFERRD